VPIDYSKYPPDWKERRGRILERASNRCEECNVENGAIGMRTLQGVFIHKKEIEERLENDYPMPENHRPDIKLTKIVLTVHHKDGDPENWDVKDSRLTALCQRCHLAADRALKKERDREENIQLSLI
jgi:hypothetical protein